MSLGKGLESLIPPQSDDQGNDRHLPAEPPKPSVHLTGHHEHDIDAGPAILSFDFTDDPPAVPDEAVIPAVASQNVAEEVMAEPPVAREQGLRRSSADNGQRMSQDYSDGRVRISRAQNASERFSDAIFHIEVSKVRPNPNQPRRNFDENALWELAKSIREFGFLQPLVVTRVRKAVGDGMDVEYELIAGERRLMAAKLLGLEYIPAIIREVNLEREKLELAIIENLQREELNPVERARAFQRLQEEFRLTQREIAAKLGKSRETVANTVRLLDLPMYLQEALERGQITESHGRFLLQIGDPAAQKKLFDDIISQNLTTRDVKVRVQRAMPRKTKAQEALSPELKMFEERLTAELGAPVKIERSADTGKIVITFYSEEELQNILRRFGGGEERI